MLTGALIAYRAHAVPHPLNIYLTEFGIQSKPNPFFGVSLAQQAEFEETSERIAWDNPRVAAFSQYLLRDDGQISRPGVGVPGAGFIGFQSGLRFANGRDNSSSGFRLPLSVSHSGGVASLWGLVRPAPGVTTVDVQVIEPGSHRSHCCGACPRTRLLAALVLPRGPALARELALARGQHSRWPADPGLLVAEHPWTPDSRARRPAPPGAGTAVKLFGRRRVRIVRMPELPEVEITARRLDAALRVS